MGRYFATLIGYILIPILAGALFDLEIAEKIIIGAISAIVVYFCYGLFVGPSDSNS